MLNEQLEVFLVSSGTLARLLLGYFFELEVSDDTKIAMVQGLEKAGHGDPVKHIDASDIMHIPQIQLSRFVTKNTMNLFTALGITTDFVQQHPSTWNTNNSFQEARCRISNLKVVNDAAERGVSLIQSFNAVITNQEEQKQYLLQVAEKHRKVYPDANKHTVVLGLEKQ